ncbi:hypothetical protein, partial [Paraconexibacter sp.]|uniref:hypothetical protein n=1 Tax=Paraconexibacter sp. TaxID=2949640 RepID=UPI003567A863
APTAVRFGGGSARWSRGRGVLVRWRAGLARDVLGYEVLRVRRGSHARARVKLTRRLIAANALSRTVSTRYVFRDRAGRPGDRYFVRARTLTNATTMYGPFAASGKASR